MRPRTIINLLALTGVVALAIASTAGASTDLRSPDARDIVPTPSVSVASDLRSPDTRDVAIGRTTSATLAPVVVHYTSSGGFDWGDASIGGGTVLFVVAAASGLAVLAVHRHRRRDREGSAAVPLSH
jgi:hypothetical protein